MGCDHPLKMFKAAGWKPGSDLKYLTSSPLKAVNSTNPLSIPCGQCAGCRLDKARDWAIRCSHEASLWRHNCFITLTYNDTHLPKNYSIDKRVFQNFMKRLRFEYRNKKIRFFACGEYGDLNLRPHYHALLFNHSFSDQSYWSTRNSKIFYVSKSLERLWPFGFSSISQVNYQTAAYCARYSMKKLNGDDEKATAYYTRRHPLTGEFHKVEPEFALMSRRPGLAADWFHKFRADVFPSDFLIVDGKKHPVPRYYDKQLTEEELTPIQRQRRREGLPFKEDKTTRRLADRAEVRAARMSRLKREL